MRHVHADVIHLWAEGAEIEFRCAPKRRSYGSTLTWHPCSNPDWHPNFEYRVKQEKKMKKLPSEYDQACVGISPSPSSPRHTNVQFIFGQNKLVYDVEMLVQLIMSNTKKDEGEAWEYFWSELSPNHQDVAVFMIPADAEIIMSEWNDA